MGIGKGRRPGGEEALYTVELLRGRWRLLVIVELSSGPRRTGELLRALTGIAKNRLNDNLRELTRAGLVRRTVTAGRVVRVEYRLTPLGASLAPVVAALGGWSARNRSKVERAKAGRRGAR